MINTLVDLGKRNSAPRFAHRRLLRAEQAWLFRQIGNRRPVLWLRAQPPVWRRQHGVLTLAVNAQGLLHGGIHSAVNAWPWADDSVPCVVLQHVAEGAPWTADLLAEAARVLEPEGRLYILRFDRASPWFWRYGRRILSRRGAGALVWPLDAMWLRRYRLSLEFRHALGERGFLADTRPMSTGGDAGHRDRRPLGSAFRATRIWVFRKRSEKLMLSSSRARKSSAGGNYGLVPARRQGLGDSSCGQ